MRHEQPNRKPANSVDRRASLPRPGTSLIGREREVSRLLDLLRTETCCCVTLTGPGGVGKTRVALHVAQELRASFADGVYIVPLDAVTDPHQIPATIARVVGLDRADDSGVALRSWGGARHALLILDTFEHLIDGALWIADLLAACSRLVVLITSRARLDLHSERVIRIPPLAYGTAESAAEQLFRDRAAALDAGIDHEPRELIGDVCRALDGLPLAIELAAPRLRLLSLAELRDQLDRGIDLLAHGPRDLPERQRSLRRSIAWSYALLPPDAQTLLRRLSIVDGRWTIDMAALLDDPPSDRSALLDRVMLLLDHSLICACGSSDGVLCFELLRGTRWFARDLLRDEGALAMIERRYHDALERHRPITMLDQSRQLVASESAKSRKLDKSAKIADITRRELEVLRLVATGRTDAQIAELLGVSCRTVNAHLRSIYGKLGLPSRSAATRYALEQHLVEPT